MLAGVGEPPATEWQQRTLLPRGQARRWKASTSTLTSCCEARVHRQVCRKPRSVRLAALSERTSPVNAFVDT